MFVNNQYGIQRREQEFDQKFVFEGVHSKEVHRRISWEKLDKTKGRHFEQTLTLFSEPPNATTQQPAPVRATHILSKK